MSNEELARTLEAVTKLTQELTASPDKALAVLVEEGFLTIDGTLTAPYRQDA